MIKTMLPLLLALALPVTTQAETAAAPATEAKPDAAAPAAGDKAAAEGEQAPAEGETAPAEGQTSPPPPPKPREPFDAVKLDQRDEQLLAASATPEDEVLWLDAAGEKFLALFQSAAAFEPNGAVILLHDSGENPIWPEAIEAVRRTLPAHGWHTLAIALPAPAAPAPPERSLPVYTPPAPPAADGQAAADAPKEGEAPADTPKDGEAAPAKDESAAAEKTQAEDAAKPAEGGTAAADGEAKAADGEQAAAPKTAEPAPLPVPKPRTQAEVESIADARMEAGWALLKSKGYRSIVLVGAGSGAERMLRLSKTHPFGPSGATTYVSAVIMISPPRSTLDGLALIQGANLPILDIFHSPGEVVEREMALRERAAKRFKFPLYDQILLPAPLPNMTGDEDRMAKRLRGWLLKATDSARAFDQNTLKDATAGAKP